MGQKLSEETFKKMFMAFALLTKEKPTQQIMDLYYSFLKDCDDEILQAAINELIKKETYMNKFPAIGTIMKYYEDIVKNKFRKKIELFIDAIQISPNISTTTDPYLNLFISEMGGIGKIRTMDEKELNYKTQEFLKSSDIMKADQESLNIKTLIENN